jgi:hypothetical protein
MAGLGAAARVGITENLPQTRALIESTHPPRHPALG